MSLNLNFSGVVLEKRKSLGYTQVDMSEMLDKSVRWYQQIEGGKVTPKLELASQICQLLDIDMNQIRDAASVDKDAVERVKKRVSEKRG